MTITRTIASLYGVPVGFLPIIVPHSTIVPVSVSSELDLMLFEFRWFDGTPDMVLVDLRIGATSLIGSSYAAIGLHGDGYWRFPERRVVPTQDVTAVIHNRHGAPGGVLLSVWGKPWEPELV